MPDPDRDLAIRVVLAGNPPLPTDGQVIREAMSRLLPIIASEVTRYWRKCPSRRCRREQCCMAPQRECLASPRAPLVNIETAHAWLATRLREELLEILVARALGVGEPHVTCLPTGQRRASMSE